MKLEKGEYYAGDYDVAVVGAGHAGCEAGLAAARLGMKTLIFSISLEAIANMPCNPHIGGSSKGHLVREIDALGGEMGKNIDKTMIQIKMLNTSKGPAVHSLRAQADRKKYQMEMKHTLEKEENLYLKQAEIVNIGVEDGKVKWVETNIGAIYHVDYVILATGINRKESTIKGIKEYEGKGISYCAVCDAFFFRGKDVAVIGDGNYAVHEAEILKPIAKSVRIITNGKSMVQNRNIDVETIKDSVKEVKGKDILEEIEFANGKTIKIDGVFVAEGIATSTDLAKRIGALVEGNNIKINENMETSVKGLYACGDCTGGILQISKAVYEGAKAGLEIIKKEDKNVSN